MQRTLTVNIILRIIEHNNRLPDHLFFYRLNELNGVNINSLTLIMAMLRSMCSTFSKAT